MVGVRRFWVGVLAAFLLLGAIDWHPDGESPHSLLPKAGEIYFPGVNHLGQPVHFDAAQPAKRPACPVCLHHLQTTGAHLPIVVTSIVPPALESAAAPAPDHGRASGVYRSSEARGPPSIS